MNLGELPTVSRMLRYLLASDLLKSECVTPNHPARDAEKPSDLRRKDLEDPPSPYGHFLSHTEKGDFCENLGLPLPGV